MGKYRGDEGECLLLLRRYYHRVSDDPAGLTFMRWQAKQGEVLVINSSELRWGAHDATSRCSHGQAGASQGKALAAPPLWRLLLSGQGS